MTDRRILLEVDNLKIHFFTDEGVVRAVDGVSYTIERGKTLCLVGESGSGKSVSARALLQLISKPGKLVDGSVLYYPNADGTGKPIDIAKLDPKSRQMRSIRGNDIAMIFQEPMSSFSPSYTVGSQIMESIQIHTAVSKEEARNRAIELLRQVGIPKPEQRVDEYPFRLSGGMLQRCMIAMALSCNPKLLIADEPTTALDVTTQAQILDLMRDLQDQYDMAIMFITHDLGVVAEIADDVAVMYLGKIMEQSDVVTVFNTPKHPYTRALLRSIPKVEAHKDKLDPIRGMVPSPYDRPNGCVFNTRCDHAIAGLCDRIDPASIRVQDHQEARCLMYDETYADQFDAEQPDAEETSYA